MATPTLIPSFDGATGWLNSGPLDPAELRGHVVLVDFWTLTCINWLRTEPFIRAWSQAYREDGLVVIGVHTPEFSFEHDVDQIRQAVTVRGIDYPVAVDNRFGVWTAFDNNYWPALYFIDRDGVIRDHHFGEEHYEESERLLQQLLGIQRDLVSAVGSGVEAEADWMRLRTPETYLGHARGENFASPGGAAVDVRRSYEFPERLRPGQWALAGDWTIGRGLRRQTGLAAASPSGSTHATRTSCCPPEVGTRSPSACSWMASLPAARTVRMSTRTETGHLSTAAFTSSSGRAARQPTVEITFSEPGA